VNTVKAVVYVLLGALAVAAVWYEGKRLHLHLVVQHVLQATIQQPPADLQLNMQQHAADEMLLRQIVDECSKRQDTVLHLDNQRRLLVTQNINPQ
jgi:hypothetical protein